MSTHRFDDRRPRFARTNTPIQMEQPGYYPGYSTLSQQDYWDKTTRDVVLKRVNEVPPVRFFSPDQARLLQAIIDRVLPQDDRIPERRIPILPRIDERMYTGKIEGYRFEDMPPDRDAILWGMEAINNAARRLYGVDFDVLGQTEQDEILKSIHDGKPPVPDPVWQRMSIKHFWEMLVHDCIEAYYAHPWAWDEIGFGGPAYPRAYFRLEGGKPEPWEKDELRYEWMEPPGSLSGELSSDIDADMSGGHAGTH